jgi:hypothetical protein
LQGFKFFAGAGQRGLEAVASALQMLAPAALGKMRPRSSDGICKCQWAVSARLDAWAGGSMTPVERGRTPRSALQAEWQLTQPLT